MCHLCSMYKLIIWALFALLSPVSFHKYHCALPRISHFNHCFIYWRTAVSRNTTISDFVKRAQNVEENNPFIQKWGEWTTCREKPSVNQSSGRIFTCFSQCSCWLAIEKCDKTVTAHLKIIIMIILQTQAAIILLEKFISQQMSLP